MEWCRVVQSVEIALGLTTETFACFDPFVPRETRVKLGEIAEAEAKGQRGALQIQPRDSIIGLKFVSQSQ